jgi:hypothetical protein
MRLRQQIRSRSESQKSRSSLTRSIHFRFGTRISTTRQRSSLSVGRGSCLRISRSRSSCIYRRHRHLRRRRVNWARLSPAISAIGPESSASISTSSFVSGGERSSLASRCSHSPSSPAKRSRQAFRRTLSAGSSKRACSFSDGSRTGGQSKYFFTTGGRSFVDAICICDCGGPGGVEAIWE